MRMSWLAEGWSKGKYKAAAASVLHSYRIPMKLFAMLNPRLDTEELVSVEIRFRSAGSGPGKLMLDNIAFYGPDFSKSSNSPRTDRFRDLDALVRRWLYFSKC